MQTQFQQGSKKNKAHVPFYTLPPRLYGQTPSEIIKEARAAVMPPPSLGIKPVFTTRPFTPKDNERTLFSSLKQKKSRRLQSTVPGEMGYNWSVSKNSDTSNQVKLPSIESSPKKKSHSVFHFSSNLSLDNLVEDFDAEALEEDISEIKTDKLPSWKKSHSCPKEGRMVKAALYKELNHKLFSARNADWNTSLKNKNGQILPKSGSELLKKSHREKSKKSNTSISNETLIGKKDFHRLLEITKDCGDYDQSFLLDAKNLLMASRFEESSQNQGFDYPNEKGDHVAMPNFSKGSHSGKMAVDELSLPSRLTEEHAVKSPKSDDASIESKKTNQAEEEISKTYEHIIRPTEGKSVFNTEEIKANLNSTRFTDKSIATCSKSEYLSREKEITKPLPEEEPYDSLPKEILELYQTVEYYGVGLKDNAGLEQQRLGTKKNLDHMKSEQFINKASDLDDFSREKIITGFDANGLKDKDRENTKAYFSSAETKKESYVQAIMNDKKRNPPKGENKQKTIEKTYEKWIGKQEMKNSTASENTAQGGWDFFWKNCYYETKEEEKPVKKVTEENLEKPTDLEVLFRLINKSIGFFKLGGGNSIIYDINCQMYQLLKKSQINFDDAVKEKILHAVTLHSENEDPRVLLSVARILFYLKFDNNLTMACKLIFSVAKFDSNDHLFLYEEDILELFMEGLGRASPLDYAESCIYGYGALKFLTMNYNILSRTLHMGALDLMTLHLKLINTACTESGDVGEQTQHALFQLTGVLRNVAAGEGALPLFITTNCIPVICKNLELFQKEEDIVTNISRTLSLISTDEGITQVLMSVENILPLIIDLMERYEENDKILIRLSFCLGNIVEHSDLARIQLLRSDVSLSTLLNLLKFYIDKDLELSMNHSTSNGDLDSEVVDDIIVKIIRIIANMSMNPIVGSNLSPVANEKSLQLSKLLSGLLLKKDPGMVLLATLGCLNNVSYYCSSHAALNDITQGIERVLGLESEDCQAEAARVLGNLTRHREIRRLILNTGGVNQLIKLLLSKDQEVVRCACGALVNMLLDSESRKQFLEAGGIDKLVDAIELFSGDWSLASLAGRAIWNSCAEDMSSAAMHNDLEHILNSLVNCLEEDNWKDGDVAWEEFASIATDLLERINSHLDSSQ